MKPLLSPKGHEDLHDEVPEGVQAQLLGVVQQVFQERLDG